MARLAGKNAARFEMSKSAISKQAERP